MTKVVPNRSTDHSTVHPRDRATPAFVFVGERRSALAISRQVHWEDGHLAAKTLHDGLRALGLDPSAQVYLNLFPDAGPSVVDPDALDRVRSLAARGMIVVGMGRIVQAALNHAGVVHRRLVHPAARGAIRARSAYHAHLARVLGLAENGSEGPCPSGSP